MKNIIKNILLLGCLMGSTSNLVAMHQKAGHATGAGSQTVHHTERKAETKAAQAQDIATKDTSKNRYQNFLLACEGDDFTIIKKYLKIAKFTQSEIVQAHITIKNERIKKFLLLVNTLFYTQHKSLPETFEAIQTNAKYFLNRFAFLNCIPHIFDLAVFFEKQDLVEHIITNFKGAIAGIISTLFKEAALTGKAVSTECLLDIKDAEMYIDDGFLDAIISQVTNESKVSAAKHDLLAPVLATLDVEKQVRAGLKASGVDDADDIEDFTLEVSGLAVATSADTDQVAHIPTDDDTAAEVLTYVPEDPKENA